MRNWVFLLLFFGFSGSAFAQTAAEYVELVCGSKNILANIYGAEEITGAMAAKQKEIVWWQSISKVIDAAAASLQTQKIDDVAKTETFQSAFKACRAYVKILPYVETYIKMYTCQNSEGGIFDWLSVSNSCEALANQVQAQQ